jgi:hypothetical protein
LPEDIALAFADGVALAFADGIDPAFADDIDPALAAVIEPALPDAFGAVFAADFVALARGADFFAGGLDGFFAGLFFDACLATVTPHSTLPLGTPGPTRAENREDTPIRRIVSIVASGCLLGTNGEILDFGLRILDWNDER